jgi:hypothetical protein
MANTFVARLAGGSPGIVALRLIIISLIVGALLEAFGFDPASFLSEAMRAIRRLFESGFTDVRHIGRMLLTGAMVVVPVWLGLRLIDSGARR